MRKVLVMYLGDGDVQAQVAGDLQEEEKLALAAAVVSLFAEGRPDFLKDVIELTQEEVGDTIILPGGPEAEN